MVHTVLFHLIHAIIQYVAVDSCSVLGLSCENVKRKKKGIQIFTNCKLLPLGKSQLENNRSHWLEWKQRRSPCIKYHHSNDIVFAWSRRGRGWNIIRKKLKS